MSQSPQHRELPLEPGLLKALRSGEPEALARLMDCLWAPLIGYARRFLPEHTDPQDIVQDAFVRLWARREELREDGSLKALLYTTVRNASLDVVRKSRRRERLRAVGFRSTAPRTPYEEVQGAELQRLAAAAVARLPEKRREVFRLVREEGLSYKDTAAVMGLSEQTVANHMSLALADLRTYLRPFLSGRVDEAGDKEARDRRSDPSKG